MAEKLSGLSSAAETERSVEKLVEEFYYKNIASAAVFDTGGSKCRKSRKKSVRG